MKVLKKVILVLVVLMIFVGTGLMTYGYAFYRQTIAKVPIDTKVTEIRNDYTYVKSEELPEIYLKSVVAVEDKRFYKHGAIDIVGIGRAFFANLKSKAFKEGGSTITQQVAKNMYYIEEKNPVKRKLAEAFTASALERKYSKKDILELYVNIIYFGDGYYGIKEATNGYLHKEPKDMNLSEITMMVGVPNAPSVYAPTANKDLCKKRQKKVISTITHEKMITDEEAKNIDNSFIDSI